MKPGGAPLERVKKPVRSISGVVIVSVMTKFNPCPHGRCIYCPKGSSLTPQSYIDLSPVALRAQKLDYDPYLQVKSRLKVYEDMGHKPSKVELIVIGGTFPALPRHYQEWFVKRCFDALNSYHDATVESSSIEEAHTLNERALSRCVGLTIETRPDYANREITDFFLKLGVTRVEVGVQTVFDDVLEKIKRGHKVSSVIEATKTLKDAGLKVVYHYMPGLPGVDLDRDVEGFKELFENPDFRPDMIKIYPTLVIPGTELYEMWVRGEYQEMDDEKAIKFLIKTKPLIPEWVRVIRIQRAIPSNCVAAGVKSNNLREIVKEIMNKLGLKCRCIRCREVGFASLRLGVKPIDLNLVMKTRVYEASGGLEYFISFEDERLDLIAGYVRVRLPSSPWRPELTEKPTAIVRELHVYGPEVPVGEDDENAWQHRGLGKALMVEAERIAREEMGVRRIAVISGVGARPYFYSLSYKRLGQYVVKELNTP
ncbi:MAG: tRNA uridine(34) 5-carboxymethylaminomethyl modification radical SAM/GNAT enzyme Elp3 [Candidatus Nezhaarchaeota archaeon]|nr:tRNA uridine(34) 5-carboxymethylaminomethyl modification radical SAM/GNAT enzyme Elp3 [Candidatus Nezhaarchaeota archaeon]MCX8142364.1 tRNA uridine(34) 5-carboxymethylaminomethyl modification radical SAM/GNAT enzyme Elp3 [Candidatus Nezhaarchaeota archaeon]MDW8050663.1 tRNA uridine(34) 5-carboxymethylaminomethyl modification radical SAM/GNAT enzyme Elp3 [Nitrososphaerota archaeon]